MAPTRVIERIRQRIEINDAGCWVWQGAISKGYGHIGWSEDGVRCSGEVHRVMYQAIKGPVATGLSLDHLCHDPRSCSPTKSTDCPHRRCCNPDHLAPVSHRENVLRGGGISAIAAARTACPEGHEYTEANTITRRTKRECRECAYARNRDYYQRNRDARLAYLKAWKAKRKREAG